MNSEKRQKVLLTAGLLLLALTFLYWRSHRGPVEPAPVTPPVPAPVPITPPHPTKVTPPVVPPKPVPPPVTPPKPPPPPPPVTKTPEEPVTTPSIPKPPPIVLHEKLIPKGIEIVRCYYSREIVAPETTFGFDINGSGFTDEFQNMITIDPGGLDIEVRNLRRVTANQIHGEMVVGSAQPTAFIYPKVLIQNLPVFRAPDPFAVVRRGDVLVIVFIRLADDGRSGRFRVVTNLDETMQKQFSIIPSHPGLQISDLEFHLPFAVEGTLEIGLAVPQGEYGLTASIGQRQVWKRDGMIRIVRPNVGLTGFVQGVAAGEKYHRPGDTIQLYLHGSGLTSTYTTGLSARVNELDMGPAAFEFISPSQMRFSFRVPAEAPIRSYGVTVVDQKNKELFKGDNIFTLVPANWIAGVQLAPPPKPGEQGLLRVIGRDLAPDYVKGLTLETDEPGIELKNMRQIDPSTIGVDISISSAVAPGDYWIHLSNQGKAIQPPYGSIIKVEAP